MSSYYDISCIPKECAICGKELYPNRYADYAYKAVVKSHKIYFCGYSCMRKYQNGKVKARREKHEYQSGKNAEIRAQMKERKVTLAQMEYFVRTHGYKSFRSQLYRVDYEGDDKSKLLRLIDECAERK